MSSDIISSLIWMLLLLTFFYPSMERKVIEIKRIKKIKELEKKFNARIITMIHRQEVLTFLGIPLVKYITIEDAEEILKAIRSTPDDKTILIILHTPGGIALAAQQIAMAIKRRKGKTIVIVPHYAMSGGTLISLAADEIYMDENAILGPVDPIINGVPAVSILNAVKQKGKKAREKYLILADLAEKAVKQIKEFIIELLEDKYGREKAEKIAEELVSGKYTHDFPITVKQLMEMGIEVKTEVPKEVYELLEMYPQPKGTTSVEYIKKR